MWRRELLQVCNETQTGPAELLIAGEETSHSLYFELTQGWTGLLVEPIAAGLSFKNRRATVSSSCLATQPRPHYAHFNWNSTALLDSENDIRAMGGIVLVTERVVCITEMTDICC